jgi:hypothetical protein
MDDDTQTTTNWKEAQDDERQNRRQFFNGLGKWSLAIVAAVAALRDGLDDVRDGIDSRFGTGPDAAGDSRQQIARHGNRPHGNTAPGHLNDYFRHANHLNGPFIDNGWTNSPA